MLSQKNWIVATAVAVTVLSGAPGMFSQSSRSGAVSSVIRPSSSIAKPADAGVRAHTNVQFMIPQIDAQEKPQISGPPQPGYFYEVPASIACIYKLVTPQWGCNPNVVTTNPSGGGRAIAIVDPNDDPSAVADEAAFSAQFGIPAGNFQVVYAPFGGATPGSCTGPATQPAVDPQGGSEIEESLDIEWAHSMAPAATLYLVEAQSLSYPDLLCAVTIASNLVKAAGGGEVSMSWGSSEFADETAVDPVFTKHGVVYFASAGDSPGPLYPSVSPNVVSVGGTTLSTNSVTGSFIYENVWQDAGGGLSVYESRPTYQNGVRSIVGSQRGSPDIAADANPNTGVWVLDNFVIPDLGTTYCGSTPCWIIVGGTSVSSPVWAGIVNAAGKFSHSTRAELTSLYGDEDGYFNDIEYGTCGLYLGYFASHGWNFCGGLGSPASYRGK
jgi:subtilase family serine protease